MNDIYLIYAEEDSAVSRDLHSTLTSIGLTVYIYEKDPTVGKGICQNYNQNIGDSLITVALISENWVSNQDKELFEEVNIANKLNKPILPFIIDNVDYDVIRRCCREIVYLPGNKDRRIIKSLDQSPYKITIRSILDSISQEEQFNRSKINADEFFVEGYKPILPFQKKKVSNPNLVDLWSLALYKEGIEFTSEANNFRSGINAKLVNKSIGLTSVQKEVYESHFDGQNFSTNNSCFLSDQHVIISAPTSAGKSLLAECFLVRSALLNTERSRAIYLAPTRALAQAKYAELKETLENSPGILNGLILSTGEDKDTDRHLSDGSFSIACMVYEKANVLFSRNPNLLKTTGVVVVDEIHLIEDLHRGPALEIMLAKLIAERRGLDLNRASDRNREKVKIVAITTENNNSEGLKRLLSTGDIPPQHIRSTERPLPVLHKMVLRLWNGKELALKPYEIVKYRNSNDRHLTYETIRSLDASITSNNIINNDIKGIQRNRSAAATISHELLLKYIKDYPKGHRILVFLPSKNDVESQAGRFKNVFLNAKNSTSSQIFPRKERNIENNDRYSRFCYYIQQSESKELSKKILEMAKYGVYIHHSDIDRTIRNSIESLCGQMDNDSDTEVVFATTTLAYGVNLSIDVVILSGYYFISNDRSGSRTNEPVSNSLYFNMIGRAGRFGKTNIEVPEVCTVIPDPATAVHFLERYYSAPVESERDDLESVLFTSNDVMEDVDANPLASAFKKLFPSASSDNNIKEESFSYPFLWAILDALRHLNYTAHNGRGGDVKYSSLGDLVKLIGENSLYALSKGNKDKYKKLIKSIIEALKQCNQHNLVSKQEGSDPATSKYRITERGEAIIDTSTHVVTLTSLSKVAAKIDKLFQTHFPEKNYAPSEIHLVGLILQEEVYRDIIDYTPECARNRGGSWNPLNIDSNKAIITKLFKENIESVIDNISILNVDVKVCEKFVEGLIGIISGSNLNTTGHYNGGAVQAVMRIYNCLYEWVNGLDYDVVISNIELFIPKSYANQETPPPGMAPTSLNGFRAFIEKVHYKVRFMAKILSLPGDDGAISLEAQRSLFLLVERVRLGCVNNAIPLFYPKQSNLTRGEASKLVSRLKVPADIILTSATPEDYLVGTEISDRKLSLLKFDLQKFAVEKFKELESELTLREGESKQLEIYTALFTYLADNYIDNAIISYSGKNNYSDTKLGKIIVEKLNFSEVDAETTDSGERRVRLFNQIASQHNRDNVIKFFNQPHPILPDRQIWISQKLTNEIREIEQASKTFESLYHIIPLDINNMWECRKADGSSYSSLQKIVINERAKNCVYVIGPWLPSLNNCPKELIEAVNTKTDKTIVFLSVAVFAALLILAERRFIREDDVSDILTGGRHMSESDNLEFPFITINHIAELFAENKDVPPAIMEAFLNHYEVNSLRTSGVN